MHVAVGIITKEEQVLLSLRPEGKPYAGYWEFPGGKIQPNETAYNALVRELREELGIDVKQAHLLFEHQHVYIKQNVDLSIWQVTAFVGEPLGLEQQQLCWFSWEQCEKLRLLAANYAVIDKVKHLAPIKKID